MMRTALTLVIALAAATASAQISLGGDNQGASIRFGGGIGLSNGESTLTMLNPNQKGDFVFLFPQMRPWLLFKRSSSAVVALENNGPTLIIE